MRRGFVCGLFVATLLLAGSAAGFAQSANGVLKLDQGWQFRQSAANGGTSDKDWLPATVPGDVHLDLLANKRIPDPFYRDDESKLQWVEQASWEYQDTFDVPAGLMGKANVDLVFDGLDAAAPAALTLGLKNPYTLDNFPEFKVFED